MEIRGSGRLNKEEVEAEEMLLKYQDSSQPFPSHLIVML
jgi:hypothetical protein